MFLNRSVNVCLFNHLIILFPLCIYIILEHNSKTLCWPLKLLQYVNRINILFKK
jgi:hypothetical protein